MHPSPFRDGTLACTGHRVLQAGDRRDQGAGRRTSTASWSGGCRTSPSRSSINVNGCPNSCARFQVADIGFKGSVARGADGEDVEVYQVHLGGHLGAEAALGRKFRGLKVEADGAADYVERVLRGYLDRREPARELRRVRGPGRRGVVVVSHGTAVRRARAAVGSGHEQPPPFFCPYCGDESLRPYGETHGEWRCESCRRAFALRTVKQAPVPERTEVAP